MTDINSWWRTLPAALLTVLLTIATGSAHGAGPPPSQAALDEYLGKVVLLDFWASWCGPCRRSFPWMNAMSDKYQDEGLVVVAVNLDQQRADADRFLERYPAKFNVWFDPDGMLAEQFGVQAMPTSVVLDASGNVVKVHRGFKTRHTAAYEQAIIDTLKAAAMETTSHRNQSLPFHPLIAIGVSQ